MPKGCWPRQSSRLRQPPATRFPTNKDRNKPFPIADCPICCSENQLSLSCRIEANTAVDCTLFSVVSLPPMLSLVDPLKSEIRVRLGPDSARLLLMQIGNPQFAMLIAHGSD